jgi:hypothetical protein
LLELHFPNYNLSILNFLFYRFWVRHGIPKFIEISASQIIEQFREGGYYEPDTCDALLRRFQQASTPINWRHFLETDFAVIQLQFKNIFYFLIF